MTILTPETVTLKETARYLYIDSGQPGFRLTAEDIERLKLAKHWLDKLLTEQKEHAA